jgi:hypothetical protein
MASDMLQRSHGQLAAGFAAGLCCLQATPPSAISQTVDNFKIPAAPDLIPDGAWEKIPNGNVTTPKGFKATGVQGHGGLSCSHDAEGP